MPNMLFDRIKSFSPVPVSRIERSIDRIQIVIRNTTEASELLEGLLSFHFQENDPSKDKGRFIKHYVLGNSSVEHMRGTNYCQWLILFQPTLALQNIIRKGIEPILGLNVECVPFINLQQVEFAYDVYPASRQDIVDLFWLLRMVTTLRYSRKNSFYEFKGTVYQGKGGNIRNGSCGLRIYLKPEDNPKFVRLEIQLNNLALKRELITLESLPVTTDLIDPLDYVLFREPMNAERLNELVATILRKRFPKGQTGSKMRKQGVFCAIRDEVLDHLFVHNILDPWHDHTGLDEFFVQDAPSIHTIHETDIPVAQQVHGLKVIKDNYKLSFNLDRFSPKLF